MSYPSVEILGRVERRRRFSTEQKLAVVAEATAPGASISDVARRHGLLPAQVFKWRRLAELGVIGIPGASELPSFVSVDVAGATVPQPDLQTSKPPAVVEPSSSNRPRPRQPAGLIEIDVGSGRRVRVDRNVDADALRRVLDVLDRR